MSDVVVTATGLTDRGLVRPGNEDGFFIDPHDGQPRIIAVADGMGGHEGGEVASALALEVIASWADRVDARGGATLSEAVLDANRVVWSKAKSDDALERMGTTLTVAYIQGDKAHLAHVGDSRAYLLRGDTLQQLTTDQTVVQQLVDSGEITQTEAARHPQRSFLTQALGTEPDLTVEQVAVDLMPTDRLVVMSDGLHGYVEVDAIHKLLDENRDSTKACSALVDAANKAGGHDNVTVVILDVSGEATVDGAAPVIVTKPELQKPKRSVARGKSVALVAGVVVLALLLWGGSTLLTKATTAYVVTARSGTVVIVKGTVSKTESPKGEVVERTDIQSATLPDTVQRELRAGIPEPTLLKAQQIVESLKRSVPQKLSPTTPTPAPTPPGPPDASAAPAQ